MTELRAMREWEANVAAVGAGRQVVLIRKGGIAEGSGGFEVEAGRFALLPTLFHQRHGTPSGEPVRVEVVCDLLASAEVASDADLSGLARFHVYDAEQLAARQRYKPEQPLTVMAVRGLRLKAPMVLGADVIRPACRSWLGLPVGEGELEMEAVEERVSVEEAVRVVERLGRGG